jgi:TRAP-type mannitol/chloroaromatic compound transport system permease small subunit
MGLVKKALTIGGLLTIGILVVITFFIPIIIFLIISGVTYVVLKEKQEESQSRDIGPPF